MLPNGINANMPAGDTPLPPNMQNTPPKQGMTMAEILASCESSMPVSVQSAYAGMQLAQAKLCKDQSMAKMNDMQKIQEKQLRISALISQYRKEKATGNGIINENTLREMKELGIASDPCSIEFSSYALEFNGDMDDLMKKMQASYDYHNCEEHSGREVDKDRDRKCREWLNQWLPRMRELKAAGKPLVLHAQDKQNLLDACAKWGCGTSDAFKNAMNNSPSRGASQNDGQWEFNLKSMTNYQEQVGSKTQSIMVSLQDFIGQYNSYLQGANTAIDRANQLLTKLASGQQ